MSRNKAYELWNKVRERNKIMEIAELMAPLFKNRLADASGIPSRYISVKTIDFDTKYLGEIIEYDTFIEFLSDTGTSIEHVLIREFNSYNSMQREIDKYTKLVARCRFFEDVDVLSMIYYDTEHQVVVYETDNYATLDELRIPEELKYFQLGLLAPIIQGIEPKALNVNELRDILSYLLLHLGFEDSVKVEFRKLIEHHLSDLEDSWGGYTPVTIFDPHVLTFKLEMPISRINKAKIQDGKAMKFHIKHVTPQGENNDRMGDVASLFALDAYMEYFETTSVNNTIDNIRTFLEGFELFFTGLDESAIDLLYPQGLSLDLQMLLNYWLLTFDTDHEEDLFYLMSECESYSYFLLVEEPFKLYPWRSIISHA